MSEATAIQDPPENAETQDEASAAASAEANPNGVNGTAEGDTKVQPGEGDKGATEGDDGKTEPSVFDEIAAEKERSLLQRFAQLHGLEGEYKSYEEIEAAIAEAEEAAADTAVQAEESDYYAETSRKLVATLAAQTIKGRDEDGNDVELHLSPKQIEAIFPHLNDLVGNIREIEKRALETATSSELGRAALSVLPKEDHDAFLKSNKALSYEDWVRLVIETGAKGSKAWKTREAEHVKDKETAARKAWDEGNKAPPGQPSQRTGQGSTPSRALTYSDLIKMTPAQTAALDPDVVLKLMSGT